jgi:SAM-dependent MidA family methyltransferase
VKRINTELSVILKDKIRSQGPLTFKEFMGAALFDRVYGFYAQGPRIGSSVGPFDTNAKFPAFGFGLARGITEAEQLIGTQLRVLELGGGTGQLGKNILSFLPIPHEYVVLEPSRGLRASQMEMGLQVVEKMAGLAPQPTFAFGNEVLDALPVHRVMGMGHEEMMELYVVLDEESEFCEQPGPLSTPELAQRLRREQVQLGRGQVAEICLEMKGFFQGLERVINPGYILFVDYGDSASNLYSYRHRNGTLRSYYRQQQIHDTFFAVGQQDLTADVDFTAVITEARELGWEFAGSTSQGEWLKNLGIQEYVGAGADAGFKQKEVDLLTGAASLGSTYDVLIFMTKGLTQAPGLKPML